VGDGTTSVAVLCGELLRQAEQLLNQRIHPQTVAQGSGGPLAATPAPLCEAPSPFEHMNHGKPRHLCPRLPPICPLPRPTVQCRALQDGGRPRSSDGALWRPWRRIMR
jgi:hypothetical protein